MNRMIKRRAAKKERDYFTQDTENAILEYLKNEDYKVKEDIYTKRIHYSFYKLVENIINTFKFYYTDGISIEDMIQEIEVFLLSKMHLYDQTKGRAYSYFGTIVKRYCINYNKINYKKLQNKVEIENSEDLEEDKVYLREVMNNQITIDDTGTYFFNEYVKYVDFNLDTLFPKEKDRKVADAVMELFRKSEMLEIFNKKALYIYIREIIDANTPQITKIISRLKSIYIELYNKYYEFDMI